jgi:uncharacterized protein YjbI with pentapeptide repeats
MDPTVVAAWIAAGVSVLTLAGTLAAQYLGYRASSRDAEKTLKVRSEQLDRTLAEQRDQLDRTLAEQNRQLDRTLAEQRTRTLNERFATAAEQLGSYNKPAVRLAGVYAMAGLADDWEENRQTCVDVLCAYLRMPYAPGPGPDAPEPRRLAFQASREVRHTAIRVITAHLREHAATSWQGLHFDFTGVDFDGGDFSYAWFSGGRVSFNHAGFSAGTVNFGLAKFSGGRVSFNDARFSGAKVMFSLAQFSGGRVSFDDARFSGGTVEFSETEFSGGAVFFNGASFSGGTVDLGYANFSGGEVDFSAPGDWSVPPIFPWTDMPPPGVELPSGINPRLKS